MASTDWTFLDEGLDTSVLARGVTAGFAPPPGGGRFVYGFHSLATARGAAGLFVNGTDFAPMSRGGSIRGCVQRAPSGGDDAYAPMLFIGLQGTSAFDAAYLLGLEAREPHRIVLKKAAPSTGLADSEGPGVLLRSSESFRDGTWLHLRLDAIAQDSGDVVLNVHRSDLSRHPAGTPRWEPVPGMDSFIDDALGIRTGSAPLVGGRAGFAFHSADVRRRAFFDSLEVIRQVG